MINSDYLGDGQYAPHTVTVTVRDAHDARLYHETYQFGDGDNADESGAFPASSTPTTVRVTVDGEPFERRWPDPDCGARNRAGVYVRIVPPEKGFVTVTGVCETEYLEEGVDTQSYPRADRRHRA